MLARSINIFIITAISTLYSIKQCKGQEQDLVFKGGSTILTMVAKDYVLIAADSKLNTKNSENYNLESFCKIHHYKTLFYSFAGDFVIADQTGKTLLNTYAILENIAKKELPINSTFKLFDSTLNAAFEQVIQSHYPKKHSSYLDSQINSRYLQVIMVSFEHDVPVYKFGYYSLVHNDHGNYALKYTDLSNSHAMPFINMAGSREHILTFLDDNPDYFSRRNENAQEKLIKLIEYEAAQNTQDVGLPIDVIKITKNGYEWVLKNQECF